MADVFTKEKRSQIMSRVRGSETKPEILVRKFLFSKGFRYRKNVKSLPGKPDIVLSKYKTIIFIHGCFWHGHKKCNDATLPLSNRIYWKNKINKNKLRDNTNKSLLRKLKWNVIEIWQCSLKNSKVKDKTLTTLILKIKT